MNPIFTTDKINNTLDHILNHSISTLIGTDFVNQVPAVNITESDDKYSVTLAAPGLTKESFSITIDNNHLIISADEKSEVKTNHLRREFNYKSFKRSFRLPSPSDHTSIKARYELGILSIDIAKQSKDKDAHKVTID